MSVDPSGQRFPDALARRCVYIWADGVYLHGRMEDKNQCILVIIGATPEGKKDLVGFQAGFRESVQSWRELLEGLKGRGPLDRPELSGWRWCLGFLESAGCVFSRDLPSAVLGAQKGQRSEQA